jgi:alpha-galactosidase
LYKIAASGEKPLLYEVKNLPQGLTVNRENGLITGTLDTPGDYRLILSVSNKAGKAERELIIKAGNVLALTPPMGWNSWNCWGMSVTEDKVRSSAQAFIDKGLIDYGWTYINIDDAWQADSRTADGTLQGNRHFPDMKALGDWLHERGLKFGIYSSPGTRTCGDRIGSYRYEATDARKYAEWGVDYLKYDWCSYGEVFDREGDHSTSAYMKPYQVMQKELALQKRDIVYSLCQYGFKDVWEWGAAVNGNCWRTTWDITDTWKSLKDIGFSQDRLYSFAKPGRWNDPDMLIVGRVGWGEHLHPTNLTIDEQYTHISLWSLLAAPLLIGCDLGQLDAFTLSLLTNAEIIDINQDPLGKQAKKVKADGNIQCWVKDLEDDCKAIGLFNLGEEDQTYKLVYSSLGIPDVKEVRDVWRQSNLPGVNAYLETIIPAHGVILLRIKN